MRQGFSLIEIIIVVAIASSIAIVVSNLSGNVSVLNNLVSQQLQSKSDITQTLQIMTTEIRSAGPSSNGAYAVDTATTSTFIFYSDIDKNGRAARVRYFLSSSSIYKGVTRPTGTPATYPASAEVVTDIIDSVVAPTTSTPLLSYYDAAYTGTQAAMTSTASVANIRLVGMSFYADVKPQQAPGPQYFSILIGIRNLRSN